MEMETIIKLEERILQVIEIYKNVKKEKSELEEKVKRLEKDLARLKGEKESVRAKVDNLLEKLEAIDLLHESGEQP